MLNSKAADLANRLGNLAPAVKIPSSVRLNLVTLLRLAWDFKLGGGELDSAIPLRL